MADPVQVTTGFTWTAAGAWGSFLALLGLLVRQWVPLRRMKVEADEKLRDGLVDRVQILEDRLDAERKEHKAELADLRRLFEARLEAKDVIHEAERALDRHEKANLNGCMEALFRAVRKVPELAVEAAEIEAMRLRQLEVEAVEKTRIRELKLSAAKGGVD